MDTVNENTEAPTLPPLSLYIHIPWCVKKCGYCDFVSYEFTDKHDFRDLYIKALLKDLAFEANHSTERKIESIFIGGGTPSLLEAQHIEELFNGIRDNVTLTDDCEISIEINPGTINEDKLCAYRDAGVNRVSLGVQTFSAAALKYLGRIHSVADTMNAVAILNNYGLENYNLDIMFGLPSQTVNAAIADLEEAIKLDPKHISYYQLTIEEDTPLYNNQPQIPDDAILMDMFSAGRKLLAENGYRHYEISAYARSGYTCRHNLNYWQFGDYIGIGVAAHGKISQIKNGKLIITRTTKTSSIRRYMLQDAAYSEVNTIPDSALPLEFLLNSSRLINGWERHLFAKYTGIAFSEIEPPLLKLQKSGYINITNSCIIPTEKGIVFLDSMLGEFDL